MEVESSEMEKDSLEREVESVAAPEDENPDSCQLPGGPSVMSHDTQQDPRGAGEGSEQSPTEDELLSTAFKQNPMAPPNEAAAQDSGHGKAEDCGLPKAKEEREQISARQDRSECDEAVDDEASQNVNEDEDEEEEEGEGESQNEDAAGQQLNGETVWRSSGSGRRSRSRYSGGGPVLEPTAHFPATQKGNIFSSGGRHKPTRRRNYHHHQGRGRRRAGHQLASAFRELVSECVGSWCISCIHMVIELIVTLTHHCGIGVEAGGVALYNLGSQFLAKITDVPGMKADAGRIMGWTRSTMAVLVEKSVTSVQYVKKACFSCFGLFCSLTFLGSHWAVGLMSRLGGERGKRWWGAVQDSRVWKRVVLLLERFGTWMRRGNRLQPSMPESPGRTGRCQPGQELDRLLALAQVPEDELDPFAVLGVEVDATEAELKKAYRQLAVQVHPDKNKHPRAGEAFKVLRAAWDIVSNPETRREYELKRMAASELSKSMNEFLTKLQDDLKEAMNTMMCTKCDGKHKRFEMDRDPAEARFCAECGTRHSAEEGDLWAESSMLGLRITYFACMDGKVYDITEWAGCQRIAISPDTHRVPYHISFGSKSSGSTRQRSSSEHPSGPTNPADLHNIFNRIFQGGAATDMAANGGFFPQGHPHSHPPGAGASRFSPPPSQTGFFMPGGQKSEPSETWAETGKPPRRRKKVRKPFQR